MRKFTCISVLCLLTLLGLVSSSKAASQDECAIWLCLPGGFPQGCGGAYNAFKNRLKKRKAPLPSFSSCAIDGNGNYKLGREDYKPCADGYELIYTRYEWNSMRAAVCFSTKKECVELRKGRVEYAAGCKPLQAERRVKVNYVEMWVNDENIGKFFY